MLRDTQVLGKNKLLCLNCILLSMKGTAFISIFFLASIAPLICNRIIQQYAYDYQNSMSVSVCFSDQMIHYLTDTVQYITSLPTYVLLCTAIVLILLHYWPVWDRHRYPPGPIPLPVLGDALIMIKHWDNIGRHLYGE